MHPRALRIVREVGTAFAVLSLYVLTMLLPLHQAAGLQNDLARIGFETIGSWSVCEEAGGADQGDPQAPTALKCPAAGIAKHEFVAILPVVLGVVPPDGTSSLPAFEPAGREFAGRDAHIGQPRAPPVQA